MSINKKAYIYCIEYDKNPIYIGSTTNINKRLKQHQYHLINNYNIKLYNFLNYKKYNIEKLKIIKTIYDDYVKIDNKYIKRRYIEEEKAIKYCLNKNIQLLNTFYPSSYNITKNNNIKKRNNILDHLIYIPKYYNSKNMLYMDIHLFNIKQYNKDKDRFTIYTDTNSNNDIFNL